MTTSTSTTRFERAEVWQDTCGSIRRAIAWCLLEACRPWGVSGCVSGEDPERESGNRRRSAAAVDADPAVVVLVEIHVPGGDDLQLRVL